MIILECSDPRCAVHGSIKTRGAEFIAKVVSDKAKRTAIVERNYATYVYKYERYLRKRSRIPVHNPECISAKIGDMVRIAETRKLSKTKSFVITSIVKSSG